MQGFMGLKFGTDGVRALALKELQPEWVARLGAAAAKVIGVKTFVIAIDGRETGPILAEALVNGLKQEQTHYEYLGIAPTPAVAHIASTYKFGGAVISASHNRAEYNGLKFFLPGGEKLSDKDQSAIEAILAKETPVLEKNESLKISSLREDLLSTWTSNLKDSIISANLNGLRIVVDSANGAASFFAPNLFRNLGAEVISIHDEPDGKNINLKSGSTDTTILQSLVKEIDADLGVAFDGDADRALAIDKTGELVDGDSLLAIFAQDMKHRNVLNGDTTAVTVMTNFGFHLAMKESEIRTHTTPVGDRHILQALHQNNWSLGGEQSGHIIFPDFSPTGDGILTALQLLDIVKRTKKSVKELSDSAMQKYPQSLRAVQIPKLGLGVPAEMEQAIKKVEKSLGEDGRVLVRASGTEPILRIMVEAREQVQVDLYAQELEETAKKIFSKNF